MRRIAGLLAAVLSLGVFGGAQPAAASAFLWISAPTWSYSGAACATPGASFYAWFLATGPTAAFTACVGPVGASASFATAAPGIGGAGAVAAFGFADPYGGLEIDSHIPIADLQNSADYSGDKTGSNGALGSPYTFTTDVDGNTVIDFAPAGNGTDTGNNSPAPGDNGSDQFAVFLYTGASDEADLCTALDGTSGCTGSESAGGAQDLGTLETDLGLGSPLVDLTDPGGNITSVDLGQSVDPSDLILVGQGDADSVPEPASILLLSQGLMAFGLFARRRRRPSVA